MAIVGALAIVAWGDAASAAAPTASRPNVLLIMTDDQGWWDLSSHGNPALETPRLDALAKESVEFIRFYAAPVCSLTRASLMTGRYPQRTGCFDTRFGHDTLAADEITIAELFKQAGYRTALFGKWHLGRFMPNHPNEQGFEEYFGFWQYGHVERYLHPDRIWQNKNRVACRGHITELITDAAINFISERREPFFACVAYNAPHSPFLAEDSLVAKYLAKGVDYDNARIYALIEQCDRNIGRLLDAVDRQEIAQNTVVLFLSDNGGVSSYYNSGLRGKKSQVYEGGVRTPLLVRLPGQFPAGAKVGAMAGVIDLLPTLAAIADVDVPADRTIDGRNLLPLLKAGGGASPHERMYHNWSRGKPSSERNWAVCDERYKLANGRLYDLQSDPGEKQDIAAAHPDIASRLRQEFLAWFEEVCAGQSFERALIEVGRDDENPIELPASWADLSDATLKYVFDGYDWDVIEGWQQPDDAAEWRINVVRPGRYQVTATYGAASDSAGGKYSVSVGDAELTAEVAATPTTTTFVDHPVGVVDLAAGVTVVRLSAVDVLGAELMSLNRLLLTRIDETAATQGPESDVQPAALSTK